MKAELRREMCSGPSLCVSVQGMPWFYQRSVSLPKLQRCQWQQGTRLETQPWKLTLRTWQQTPQGSKFLKFFLFCFISFFFLNQQIVSGTIKLFLNKSSLCGSPSSIFPYPPASPAFRLWPPTPIFFSSFLSHVSCAHFTSLLVTEALLLQPALQPLCLQVFVFIFAVCGVGANTGPQDIMVYQLSSTPSPESFFKN